MHGETVKQHKHIHLHNFIIPLNV